MKTAMLKIRTNSHRTLQTINIINCFHPPTPRNEQDMISLSNINTISSPKVMRNIRKYNAWGIIMRSKAKCSKLTLHEADSKESYYLDLECEIGQNGTYILLGCHSRMCTNFLRTFS